MKSIYLTGSTGFIGKNFIEYFKNKYLILKYQRGCEIEINTDVVLHVAGKAHDTNYKSNLKSYYDSNTVFTSEIYNKFLNSNSKIFIYISSIKAVADFSDEIIYEDNLPLPYSEYGISKLISEFNITNKHIPATKKVFILRPAMIHGRDNKGNLNLLYKFIKLGIPWPFLQFENKRSFCSIDNFLFILEELIERDDIQTGIYNICDDEAISTNELVQIISEVLQKRHNKISINKKIITTIAKIGDLFFLPLNTKKLKKITSNFIISNYKIKNSIGKNLPFSTRDGLKKTLINFKKR